MIYLDLGRKISMNCCKEKSKIIIYGAGDYGKRLYHFLKSIHCTIDYFCQTICSGQTQYYDDIEIISLIQLSKMTNEEIIVLIAIRDNEISRQVKGQLLDWNYSFMSIYECGEFISQNISDAFEEGKFRCNICGNEVKKFERGGVSPNKIFDKYHIIGGGIRENAICPLCGSMDRTRWLYWVLGRHIQEIFYNKCSVLHIAPEIEISKRIQSNILCDYYTGDITQGASMHIVDVTDIQFRDDFFDYIILNHVLEHIENEKKAIMELKRVVKPGGKIILSFPICTDRNTYENSNIRTPEARLDEYGQEDHVRLYGKDYKTRLEAYGLKVDIFSPQSECSREEISKYGFIYDDVSIVCSPL